MNNERILWLLSPGKWSRAEKVAVIAIAIPLAGFLILSGAHWGTLQVVNRLIVYTYLLALVLLAVWLVLAAGWGILVMREMIRKKLTGSGGPAPPNRKPR